MRIPRSFALAVAALLAAAASSCPAAAQQASARPRAAAGRDSAASDSVAVAAAPTPGSYSCVRTVWAGHPGGSFRFESQGYLTLGADGSYAFSSSHLVGRWTATPATHAIAFAGGYFGDMGPLDATYSAAGAPHVDIIFHSHHGDTHWVCAEVTTRAPAGARPGSATAPATTTPSRP